MIRILVISPAPDDGTSFYRCWGPFNRLSKDYPGEVEIIEGQHMNITWQTLTKVDIVFMQRPYSNDHKRIADICEWHRVPLIVDYDDNLFAVGDHNRSYMLYSNKHIQGNIRRICERAQQVWVTTENMRKVYGEFSNAVVYENAIDTELFTAMPHLNRTKAIVYRGGDSHYNDLKAYEKQIKDLIKDLPDYEFHFFGYCPDFIRNKVSGKRLKHHKFTSPWLYMKFLAELRPKVVMVPLKDTEFNKSKSDVSWLEATMAGAISVVPDFIDSFKGKGLPYSNPKHFYDQIICATKLGSAAFSTQDFMMAERSLDVINKWRMDCMELILKEYSPKVQISDISTITATDAEAYGDLYGDGANVHNESYLGNVHNIVDLLVKEYNPKSFLDIGCGSGVFVAEFLKRGIEAYGIDKNIHWKKDFDEKYPDWKKNYINEDFAESKIDSVFDLIFCIEVMEHLPDKTVLQWIEKIKTKCHFLVFTSVPWSDGTVWDKYWGHINVKAVDQWVEIFEHNGFKLLKKHQPHAPMWGLMFINANI